MMNKTRLMRRLSLTGLLLLQMACVGSTPPSEFYLLEPVAEAARGAPASAGARLSLALAPVRIPPYLDRAQLVRATGKNTYQLNELHRWAESLDDNITRVMLQDLAVLVPAEVVSTTSVRAKQAALRVMVNILEFHVDPEGRAGLVAQWQVSRGDETLLNRQSNFREPASKNDVSGQVQALNLCLNQLSRSIAEAVRSLAAD